VVGPGGYDSAALPGGTTGELDGRTAPVSGGARGTGVTIAHGVVEGGGRVVIGDLLDVGGTEVVVELREERARFVHLDVTDPDQWRDAVGGAIVTISSASGLTGLPMQLVYTASKWGVRGLTGSAALELARDGIRVDSVHPGPIRTPMTEAANPAVIAVRDQVLAVQPVPRLGEPEEVARLVVFLASEEASSSTDRSSSRTVAR
jgi:NAD(P)-dependent dehydrogenase (short-subunit alcohol dehydrogenase family)